MTDVCTAALLPAKLSSDDDSRFRHGFGAEVSLPLSQSTASVTHGTTSFVGLSPLNRIVISTLV